MARSSPGAERGRFSGGSRERQPEERSSIAAHIKIVMRDVIRKENGISDVLVVLV
jgi:hypothetical protein